MKSAGTALRAVKHLESPASEDGTESHPYLATFKSNTGMPTACRTLSAVFP